MERVEKNSVLTVRCPLIGRKVVLYKQTWEEHIIPQHPEVCQHLNMLIKDTLEKPDAKIFVFSNTQNPEEVLIYKECPHFLPPFTFMRFPKRG